MSQRTISKPVSPSAPNATAKAKKPKTTLGFGVGKYREIVFSVALFLVFDIGVLIMAFFISQQIAADALGVNLAGRQRMLSQRTVKTLLQVDNAIDRNQDITEPLNELKTTYQLFDTTLTAFQVGGRVTNADGQSVLLGAVSSDEGQQILQKALAIWQPYKAALAPILAATDTIPTNALEQAIIYASQNNLVLLKLMNDLTVHLEQVAAQRADRLRLVQLTGIILALINFFIILFHFVRRLRASDAATEKARQETRDILETVNEGLFLLDQQGRIGSQHSAALATMLGHRELADRRLMDILRDRISPKLLQTAQEYIDVLFQDHVKEKLVAGLNPLREVQVNVRDDKGHYQIKYLDFNFKRVHDANNKISYLQVTINDVTRQVLLAQELAASQKRAEEQMDLLMNILHVEPHTLSDFMNRAAQSLNDINSALKEQAKLAGKSAPHKNPQQLIKTVIFPIVHALKGEAALLELDFFTTRAHAFEDTLTELQNRPTLTGEDLLGLVVHLDHLMSHVDAVNDMVNRLVSLTQAFKSSPTAGPAMATATPTATAITSASTPAAAQTAVISRFEPFVIDRLIQRMAADQGKQVTVTTQGFENWTAPPDWVPILRDVFVQLARNAVTHGIETPAERAQKGKSLTALIEMRLEALSDGTYRVVFRDDGRGIAADHLRTVAVRSGRYSTDELATWTEAQLVDLIFEPGFSTANQVSTDAGRGVGMDIIKNKVRQLGGQLQLFTQSGRFCEWQILLPMAQPAQI